MDALIGALYAAVPLIPVIYAIRIIIGLSIKGFDDYES